MAPPCLGNYVWFFIFNRGVLRILLWGLNGTRCAGRRIVFPFTWSHRRCSNFTWRGAEAKRSSHHFVVLGSFGIWVDFRVVLRRSLLDLDDNCRVGRVVSQSSIGCRRCSNSFVLRNYATPFEHCSHLRILLMILLFFLGVSRDIVPFGSLLYAFSQR